MIDSSQNSKINFRCLKLVEKSIKTANFVIKFIFSDMSEPSVKRLCVQVPNETSPEMKTDIDQLG